VNVDDKTEKSVKDGLVPQVVAEIDTVVAATSKTFSES
jgi:hypothetical protein